MDKGNILDRFFPDKYDFYEMLTKQAEINAFGVEMLQKWLSSGSDEEKQKLLLYVKEADEGRMIMESKLIEAFTTPFDRADIYSFSITMDKIIKYTKSTLLAMETYEVATDDTITTMVDKLKQGMDFLSESINILKNNPINSQENIIKMRAVNTDIERLYREGMAIIFNTSDSMNAIKHREVYHYIKNASLNLEDTVDIFHRIVIRLI
ncbi:DUF47 family protein [Clostridium bowmanii]|uniref:DUF47 domain-containing protein n=1 Tax=Clostridium bowmanii TaxID=132925 RepID=UPI001C0E29D5|nr:DUF47 family protein [Clostridium bowmanii]MBU3189592.1 DUF47 family protein [Clostridium bowmanii]MCA1073565.1 DUF47 family protein [Clostridium bowmanii]